MKSVLQTCTLTLTLR